MSHDEIDRILSREQELLPSSGFSVSVMEAVRREAVEPPPIPFPWKRAVPGLLVAVAALVAIIWIFVSAAGRVVVPGAAAPPDTGWQVFLGSTITNGLNPVVLWTCGTLVLTVLLVMFSMRLAGSRR